MQEAIQQFRALLELGAEVEGSPAAARMQQLFDTYLGVRPCFLAVPYRRYAACIENSSSRLMAALLGFTGAQDASFESCLSYCARA